jgi:hypothetical protein
VAALTNINAPALVPAANPLTNTCTAGPDTLPLQFGGKYQLRFVNTGAVVTVTLDDPVSQNPGSATTFNPDVPILVAATTGIRAVTISADRFRDPVTGLMTMTYSISPTMTVEVHGPL